jgi:hypothetical protein
MAVEHLKTGTRPPFPYSDVRLLPYLQHSFGFLREVAVCDAMANLLASNARVPYGVMASPLRLVPTRSFATTALPDVSITETLLEPKFVTYARP